MFTCTHCIYTCKKGKSLNKHMVTIHDEHAKKHNRKEDINVTHIDIQDLEEVQIIKRTENTGKSGQ